jgi:UDP-glucose 4-epimerase
MIVELTDSSSPIVHGPPNDFDVQRFVGNPKKAHKILGYEAKVTLERGLETLRERMAPALVSA